jgi:hypothetical protein
MPLYSQLEMLPVFLQVPSEPTDQKSGHLGISGGHAPDALDWVYSAYPMNTMAPMSMMIAMMMTMR